MRVDEVRAENMHIAMDADNTHIAMDADEMHIAMDADNAHIAIDADNTHIAMAPDDMHIAMDADNAYIAMDADYTHIAMAADDMHIAMDADNMHIVMDADDTHIAMDADNAHIAMDANNTHSAMNAYDIHIAMGDDNMHMAVEVVNMNVALDDDDMLADDMHAEAVEEYHTPEDYAERLEAQGSKRDKQVRRDSLAKMTKRWNKMLQKRRTVCIRKERLEFTAGVVMGDVDDDIMHIAMDATNLADERMPAEITMTEQHNEIMGVMETLIYGAEEIFQDEEEMRMCFDMMLHEVVD